MTQSNERGITTEQIDTAFEVIEDVREWYKEADMDSESDIMNDSHCLLQTYEGWSDFE